MAKPGTGQPYLDSLFKAAQECTGMDMPDLWEYRGARHLAGKCDPRKCKAAIADQARARAAQGVARAVLPKKPRKAKPAEDGPLREYRVYFDQVNQSMHRVVARGEVAAIEKARREWKREHCEPGGTYVEQGEEVK